MPFKPGQTPPGAKPFQPGQSGNPSGRPKGARSRSTVARRWLELTVVEKNPISQVVEEMTVEDRITLAMLVAARNGSHQAYEKVMDSAYGKATQPVEMVNHAPEGVLDVENMTDAQLVEYVEAAEETTRLLNAGDPTE